MGLVDEPIKNRCKNVFKTLIPYFPAFDDGLWNFVIPISGVALSCFSFSMYVSFLKLNYYYSDRLNEMYNYGYLILSTAVGIDLYYGLIYNNKSRFGFWILSKVIDLLFLMIPLVLRLGEWPFTTYIYVVTFLIAPNVSLICYVVRQLKNIPQEPVKAGSETTNLHTVIHV